MSVDERDEASRQRSLVGLFEGTFAQRCRVRRRRSHTCGSVPGKLRVPVQLINDVSVQVEVGGACLCDSTTAPPLLDIATVAITDYYNSYVSSGTSIDRSVDIHAVLTYRHVRLSSRSDKIDRFFDLSIATLISKTFWIFLKPLEA